MTRQPSAPVELVVFDMAGTTVADDGLVEQAFLAANDAAGLAELGDDVDEMLDYVRQTMGFSKIEVFRHLSGGDEVRAHNANTAFEKAYAALVSEGQCHPVAGAVQTFALLRSAGMKLALTTGFAADTQRAIIDALGWRDIVDIALCPSNAGRGRPFPDMPLTALLRTGATSVASMVVVGDTTADITSGLRAGAGAVYGVLTGAHDERALRDAGATDVLDSVAELPRVLEVK
jgi:phosphonatase-like hydrolase